MNFFEGIPDQVLLFCLICNVVTAPFGVFVMFYRPESAVQCALGVSAACLMGNAFFRELRRRSKSRC